MATNVDAKKRRIVLGVGTVVVLSLFYVGLQRYVIPNTFKSGHTAGYEKGTHEGAREGAAQIIAEVVGRTIDLEACQPINLFVGERKVDLINVQCLGKKERNIIEKRKAKLQKEQAANVGKVNMPAGKKK